MGPIATQQIEIGAIVRLVAQGSRESDGVERVIPAIVSRQWPDGSLDLYSFHFTGSPLLQRSVRPEMVEMVMSRTEFDAIFEGINRRITEIENQLAAMSPGWKPPAVKHDLKFSLVDDAR